MTYRSGHAVNRQEIKANPAPGNRARENNQRVRIADNRDESRERPTIDRFACGGQTPHSDTAHRAMAFLQRQKAYPNQTVPCKARKGPIMNPIVSTKAGYFDREIDVHRDAPGQFTIAVTHDGAVRFLHFEAVSRESAAQKAEAYLLRQEV